MALEILVYAICAWIVLHSAYRIYLEVERKNSMIQNLEKRISILEQTRSTRIPYEVAEYMLNARAAINREKEEHQLSLDLLENAEAWMERAMTVGTKREK